MKIGKGLMAKGKREMGKTLLRKTISLPPELARDAENMASEEGKTLSAVVQDALRLVKKTRLKTEFVQMQNYWSKKAKEKGILNEKDLQRYIKR